MRMPVKQVDFLNGEILIKEHGVDIPCSFL